MVEGARLEYECAGYTAPRVRIPPSPPIDMFLKLVFAVVGAAQWLPVKPGAGGRAERI